MKNFLCILLCFYSFSYKASPDNFSPNRLYDNAWLYFEKKDYLKAFSYFDKAKNEFLKQKNRLGAGKCLMNMAIIQDQLGDQYGSQETAINALHFFDKKNTEHREYLTANYNTLGITSSKLKNYNKAIIFYNEALLYSNSLQDKIIYQNNLGSNFTKLKSYHQAISILSKTLNLSRGNDANFSRTLTNLANAKWLQNPDYNPIPEFQKALKMRLKENDNWGLNSSYAHIADYYADNNKDSALVYAKKMYAVAKELKSPDDQIEALQKLISLENPQETKRYFTVYQKLNDSLLTARGKAKNQFALIRYETEKNKADFLKAKAESTERQNHIIKQYILIAVIILLLIVLTMYYRKRQKRLQQEKLLEVKNTELKYSKKVHDKVANRIYQIMSQVENNKLIDKDALLFGLENAYETSRDISYDNKDINENQNFSEQINKMLSSYASDSIKVLIIGIHPKLWEGVSFQNKTEVYLILQELMTNMKKHSHASITSVKFYRDHSLINISYTDNGIGIRQLSPKNGIQNVENRINVIGGKIIFDTEINNLLKINISFPV